MHLGLKRGVKDALDSTYLKLTKRTDLPPYSLRAHVGPVEEYEQIPAEYIAYCKLLCSVSMTDSILDIGCGTGRFANALYHRPHFFRGRYRGFDVDPRAIGWAKARVGGAGRDAAFTHVDLANGHYNPMGTISPDTSSFPYEDKEFDFVFAMSVFTHLLHAAAANYLAETSRVLRPGGRALLSFVFLPPGQTTLGPVATERLYEGVLVANGLRTAAASTRVHSVGGVRTVTPDAPEIVTFQNESEVRALAAQHGLATSAVRYGSWFREDGGPAFQDLVLLTKI